MLAIDTLVTTRADGNLGDNLGDDPDAVAANRARAAATLGCAPGDVVWARQVHGRDAAVVDGPVPPESLAVDALVTATPGLGLAIKVADCTPLWLYDPGAHVLGCVHAGWRGTTQRVAEAAVAAMTTLGADPGQMVAGIGPTIGAADYQFGEEVADAAAAAGLGEALAPDGTGRWTFDLVAANRRVLTEAGVPATAIGGPDAVTGPGTPYFSHRAEAPCGRFALLARLRAR
jgi:purine-nucleoside/S-methyl-5'-thioadenosine phosphorylase / adenosine deaminase